MCTIDPCTSANCKDRARCCKFDASAAETKISDKLASDLNYLGERCIFFEPFEA